MQEHGTHDLELDGQIIIGVMHGSWNLPQTEIYIQDIQKLAESIYEKPWYRISDMRNWELAIPESEVLIAEFFDWCRQHGCVDTYYVVDNMMQKSQLMRAYAGANTEPKIFGTLEEATQALKANYNLSWGNWLNSNDWIDNYIHIIAFSFGPAT